MSGRMDKCTETYSLRIPEVLKNELDKLDAATTASLKEKLLFVLAREIHQSKFDPLVYLSTE